MFIPTYYGPIINKTIVYSDIVIPTNSLGKDIVLTKVSNVSPDNFEADLNFILECNPDIKISTIQYSKQDEYILFYAEKNISLEKYLKSKTPKVIKHSAGNGELLVQLLQVYVKSNPIVVDSADIISASTYFRLATEITKNYSYKERKLKEKMCDKLKENSYTSHYISIDWDDSRNCLVVKCSELISIGDSLDTDDYDKGKTTKICVKLENNQLNLLEYDINANGTGTGKNNAIKLFNCCYLELLEISKIYEEFKTITGNINVELCKSIQLRTRLGMFYVSTQICSSSKVLYGESISLDGNSYTFKYESLDYHSIKEFEETASDVFKRIPIDISNASLIKQRFEAQKPIKHVSILDGFVGKVRNLIGVR